MAAPSLGVGAARLARPALNPGTVLRYRLEYRSVIAAQSRGPIYTPEAAHQDDVSLSSQLVLKVLWAKTDPNLGPLTRIQVTYESVDALVGSDAYDPGAEQLEKEYRGLQGQSFEFTVDRNGQLRDVAGLAKLEQDRSAPAGILEWLGTLTLPMSLERDAWKPGEKWSRIIPLPGAPLAGLAWRTASRYRDTEPCPPVPGAANSLARQECAVIDTQIETIRQGGHGPSTPLAYRRHGLQTSGTWTGHGASRTYISLRTGLVTSSTGTDDTHMNLIIAGALSGSKLQYTGRVQSTSQLTLIGFRADRRLPQAP